LSEGDRISLVKPTLETVFHIDYEWWSKNDREWRGYLIRLLSSEDQENFKDIINSKDLLDFIDDQTGEVHQVEGLHHVLMAHSAQREEFLGERIPVIEAVFRLFVKNSNAALSVTEIAEQLNQDAKPILRILSGAKVYRGIRPVLE
jgi:hypothetical protein